METFEEKISYSKISSTGQLYLPSSVKRDLNLKPGDVIVFQKNDKGEITLKKGKLKIEVE